MLELIVLGEIPGTSFRISFMQIIQFVLVISVIGLIMLEIRLHKHGNSLQDIIDRLSL